MFGGRDTRWLGAGAGGGIHPREGACYLSRTRPGNWVQLRMMGSRRGGMCDLGDDVYSSFSGQEGYELARRRSPGGLYLPPVRSREH